MSTVRPSRVWAVALRDWRIELAGRRGLGLPIITGLLLLPVAGLRVGDAAPPAPVAAVADPPAALREDPRIVENGAGTRVDASTEPWRVRGPIPPPLREALDEARPAGAVVVHDLGKPPPLPPRSLWLALISGSVLTGALSSSVPGERSGRTLPTLLTAAITRTELVLGKWLAWTLFGGAAAWLSAGVAIALGRQAAGWWLLPLPWVAGGTVALGLYLVRNAADVISGATIPLRVLPAVALVSGGLSLALAQVDPLLGALVPIGGVLLTAGSLESTALTALAATLSTAMTSALLLWRTGVDLGRPLPPATAARLPWWAGPAAALAWWLPTEGPRAWTLGGNPDFTEALPPEAGWLAGGLALGWLLLVGLARQTGARLAWRPGSQAWLALGLLPLFWLIPTLSVRQALTPGLAAVLAILAQEAVFRGWLLQRPLLSIGVAGWVLAPWAPWWGWLSAAALYGVARQSGSFLPGAIARIAALLLLSGTAWAGPLTDVEDRLRARSLRAIPTDMVLGQAHDPLEDVRRWDAVQEGWAPDRSPLLLLTDPERQLWGAPLTQPAWLVRPIAALAEGDLTPVGRDGDDEADWVSPRLGGSAAIVAGPFEGQLELTGGLDLGAGVAPWANLRRLKLGVHTGGFFAGIATEPRWYGPGRFGSLTMGDDARPLPALEVSGTGRLPGVFDVLGRFSVELAGGYIPGERRDVSNPGWLVLDVRWLPLPMLEIGATRTSIFGGTEDGVERPIDIGQLILPTDPHVYDDPDQEEPDTDELVALDARLTLPFAHWLGGPVKYLDLWVQYGGEDMIVRELGPIPYPSLAGIGNLYGGELAIWHLVAGAELVAIEDDYFRWYTGHRVYHDGWTRDGHVLGHPRGGDQTTWAFWLGLWGMGPWTLDLRWEEGERLLVADLLQDNVFVFPTREHRSQLSLEGSWLRPGGGRFTLAVETARITGLDFQPGADVWQHRVRLDWRGAARSLPTR